MRKWWVCVIVAAVLMGCNNGQSQGEQVNEQEVEEIEATETIEEVESVEEIEENAEFEFVLQQSDIESGLSPENDDALRLLAEMVENDSENIGEEGTIEVQYTDIYLQISDGLFGVFILSNRTEEAITNIGMHVTMEFSGQVVLEELPIWLSHEHFGVLEPDTAMPLYVEIPPDQHTVFQDDDYRSEETATRQEIVRFDLTEKNPESYESLEYEQGYRPEYRMNVLAEIDDEVPELEFVLPNNLQDEEDGNVRFVQNDLSLEPVLRASVNNDITIFFTGLTREEVDFSSIRALFLIMNRRNDGYKNIEFGFTLKDSTENIVLENELIFLSEEEFGVLESNTIMPVYIDIPDEKFDAFVSILVNEDPVYHFESWDAEVVDE